MPGGGGPADQYPPGMPYPPAVPPLPNGGSPQGDPRDRYRPHRGATSSGDSPGAGGPGNGAFVPLLVRPFAGFGVPSEFNPYTGALQAAPTNTGRVSGFYGEIGGVPVVLYRQHGRLGLRIGTHTIDLELPVVAEVDTVAHRTTRFALVQGGTTLGALTYRSLPEELDFGAYLRDVLADPQRRARMFAE